MIKKLPSARKNTINKIINQTSGSQEAEIFAWSCSSLTSYSFLDYKHYIRTMGKLFKMFLFRVDFALEFILTVIMVMVNIRPKLPRLCVSYFIYKIWETLLTEVWILILSKIYWSYTDVYTYWKARQLSVLSFFNVLLIHFAIYMKRFALSLGFYLSIRGMHDHSHIETNPFP